MRRSFFYAAAILIYGSFSAVAQETELDPVTISASLNPVRASQTGRNLIVVKGEKLASLPVHSIDELLRYIPGVEVQARGPFGAQSNIIMRGGTFQQVLVIVDGVRVNDPNTGHFTSYIPIAPAEIDRIEILKGASSAVYGSEAVGGVVNIITKTFASRAGQRITQVTGQLTGGEYDLFSANAGAYVSNGKTAFGGGVLSNNTSGQPQRGTRGFVYSNTISASLSHRFNDAWMLAVRSSYDRRRFAAQNFFTTFVSDTAEETVKTFWNQLQLTRIGIRSTLRFHAGYKSLKDSFSFNPRTPTNQNRSGLFQALVTDEIRLSPSTTLTPGLQYLHKKIISNDRGNHVVQQAAAFLVLNQQVGNRFFVSPAARLEWNQRTGWEVVPQINLSWRSAAVQLRGSAGKTIRDADFTERFNNYNRALVISGRIGNPDLSAERSFSYEAGADYFPFKSLKLSGTFFQRFHDDLIDYVTTPYSQMPRKVNLAPNGTYALARNIAEVNTTGFEADVQYSYALSGTSSLWSTLGLVWMRSRSSNQEPSFYVSSHARFLGNFNVQYLQKRFALAVNGLYKKRQPQQAATPLIAKVSTDYWIMNLKGEVFLWEKNLSAFVEVDNLFDRKFTDILGSQMPGRWFMGGIKISLSE
jgi:iron complex outermembrane receptor protein